MSVRTGNSMISMSAVLLASTLCSGAATAAQTNGADGETTDGADGSGGESSEEPAADAGTTATQSFAQQRHDERVKRLLEAMNRPHVLKSEIKALEEQLVDLGRKKGEIDGLPDSPPEKQKIKQEKKEDIAKKIADATKRKTDAKAEKASLPTLPPSITGRPYFEGAPGTFTLNALGHARILVDWPGLEAEFAGAGAAAALEAFSPGIVTGVVSGLATSLTASATAAIEDVVKFSEKAIKSRLEREAVVALVDRLSREFCTDTSTAALLPHLCNLTEDAALNHVSSGTAQLRIIRAAAIADLRALPGRAGMVKGLLENEKLDDVRADLMTGLTQGESPVVLFVGLADAVGSLDAATDTQEAGRKELACRLDLTTQALHFADALASQSDEVAAAAAFIAASAVTSRCQGKVLGSTGDFTAKIDAWKDAYPALERLAGPWRIAEAAAIDYAKSAESLTAAPTASGTKPSETGTDAPDVQVNVNVDAGGEAEADAEENEEKGKKEDEGEDDTSKEPSEAEKARLERAKRARDHALVALRFGRALTALTIARARVSRDVSGEPNASGEALTTYGGLQRRMQLAELVVLEDWSTLITEIIGVYSPPSGDAKAQTQGLRRLSGMLDALATEDDPKKLLAVIRAAALPVASWRIKQREGAFTASLGLQLGFTTAFEIRRGTYGAAYYQGQPAWAAPTLFAPIGMDLAWRGKRNTNGLFFSVVDPAAFLQYDVHRGGRLPGPRVTTVFAPGIAYRCSLGNQPLSLMLYLLVRPQLRTWEPTVSDPGATAFQVGVAFTWDVPFVVFGAHGRKKTQNTAQSTTKSAINTAIEQHNKEQHQQ